MSFARSRFGGGFVGGFLALDLASMALFANQAEANRGEATAPNG